MTLTFICSKLCELDYERTPGDCCVGVGKKIA